MAAASVNRADIQGLAAFGYGKLTQASYLLVRIRDTEAARKWCATAPLSTAEEQPTTPDTALQIGFTADGLRSLGVAEQIVRSFSPEFVTGMAGDTSRSRRLGDIETNQPAQWLWGGADRVPHAVVMAFAKQRLDSWLDAVQCAPWNQAFEVIRVLPTSDMHGYEPFGFKDGIGQPEIDWQQQLEPVTLQQTYRNRVALGEFVLGYRNEYGKYTDRPVIDQREDPNNDLPNAEDDPAKKDVARNGSYLVLRQLEQDVAGFWEFIDGVTQGNATGRAALGAQMVGRTTEGDPLIPASDANAFTYDDDPDGLQCPFGAHIRRANPRNADVFGGPGNFISRLSNQLGLPRPGARDDLMSSTRFHRILRRGREYGCPGEPEGIQFACLNANIARQFEFVQGAWLMNPKFNGMTGESDPLLGNRTGADCFSINEPGRFTRSISGLPQFIRVRGGAYFFMPGIAARRFLTRGG